jgi:hypothetical protein
MRAPPRFAPWPESSTVVIFDGQGGNVARGTWHAFSSAGKVASRYFDDLTATPQ